MPDQSKATNWYCPKCECEVDPHDVTFDERHDPRSGGCGETVGGKPQTTLDDVKKHIEKEAKIHMRKYREIMGFTDKVAWQIHSAYDELRAAGILYDLLSDIEKMS